MRLAAYVCRSLDTLMQANLMVDAIEAGLRKVLHGKYGKMRTAFRCSVKSTSANALIYSKFKFADIHTASAGRIQSREIDNLDLIRQVDIYTERS